jgi:hypothetical protein
MNGYKSAELDRAVDDLRRTRQRNPENVEIEGPARLASGRRLV